MEEGDRSYRGGAEMAAMDLPMVEILWRLPLKPLVRFKCVSKHWYDLITYVLQNQIHSDVLLKHEVKNDESGEIETRFSFLKHPFTAAVDDDDQYVVFHSSSLVHGYSHGIVCFSDKRFHTSLYNPVTGELRNLPPSSLLNNIIFRGLDSRTLGCGFGYDSKSRDFKVVRIVEFFAHSRDFSRPPRAEVFDFGKDGWREIQTPIPANPIHMPSCDMNYQGFYYWWATHNLDGSEVILSFDFTNEVFGLIPMPEGSDCDDRYNKSLGVLNEYIVLLSYPCIGIEKSFHVWIWKMVNDDHDREVVSWTKLFTIGPLLGVRRPLAFVSSDELLMEDTEGQLTLCNIFNTQHLKPLPIKGEFHSFKALLFHKASQSVKGGAKLA